MPTASVNRLTPIRMVLQSLIHQGLAASPAAKSAASSCRRSAALISLLSRNRWLAVPSNPRTVVESKKNCFRFSLESLQELQDREPDVASKT